jgi:hypothetical protein
VLVDEVSEPHLDGTRGSALYRIPLRLSRQPSAEWAELFEHTWDHPPRFSTMHRPGILSVLGDLIVLDGTTMEELERHHRDTLLLVLENVNREIAEQDAARTTRAEAERRRREEHQRNVEDTASRLRFDDRMDLAALTAQGELTDSPPPSARPWTIEGGATIVPPDGRDASGFAWKLRRGDEARRIVVWVSGSAMASNDDALSPDIAEAKHTEGRSVLESLVSQLNPPAEVLVSTHGVRWEPADKSRGTGSLSTEIVASSIWEPEGRDRSRSSRRGAIRLGLLKELRDLILENKDAARMALDNGDQVTPRLINAERRIWTAMKQLGDQEFPLDLTNFANQAQNAHWAMGHWEAADTAVERMIIDATQSKWA